MVPLVGEAEGDTLKREKGELEEGNRELKRGREET